jgi:hypothetical protein
MTEHVILQGIIDKNGEKYQLGVVVEELLELAKEVQKRIRKGGNDVKISEEFADVQVVMQELAMMVPKIKTHAPMYKRYKLARLKVVYLEGDEP